MRNAAGETGREGCGNRDAFKGGMDRNHYTHRRLSDPWQKEGSRKKGTKSDLQEEHVRFSHPKVSDIQPLFNSLKMIVTLSNK